MSRNKKNLKKLSVWLHKKELDKYTVQVPPKHKPCKPQKP